MIRTKYLSIFMIILLLFSQTPINHFIHAKTLNAGEGNLVVHYDMSHADGKLTDLTHNGYNADLVGFNNGDFTQELGEKVLNFTGDKSKYVKLPKGIIKDEAFTIEITFSAERSSSNWLFALGTKEGRWPNVNNYIFLNPISSSDSGKVRFGIKDSSSELLFRDYSLAADDFYTFTSTFNENEITFFVNGEKVGSMNHDYSVMDILEKGTQSDGVLGYLGKSLYEPDAAFIGKIADFKVYSDVLTDEEVSASASKAALPKKILDYDMSMFEEDTVIDRMGNFNGTLINATDINSLVTDTASVLEFGGTNGHIEIPEGVLDGKTSITVSSLVNWKSTKTAEWLFALGQDSSKYLYFTPKYNTDHTARFGIATNGWRNEVSVKAPTLKLDEWQLVTTVISEEDQTLKIYIDGEHVATAPTAGFTLADINNNEGISGYIARSMYDGDPYFKGMIADFEIYDRTLSEEAIKDLAKDAENEVSNMGNLALDSAAVQLDYSTFLNENVSKDEVKTDLLFTKNGANGTTITWTSSDQNIITNEGVVNRPAFEEGDVNVVITATISDGTDTITKRFNVIVKGKLQDAVAVVAAAEALNVHNVDDVRGNITLPTEGEHDTKISWESEYPEIISETGEVNRPEYGDGDIIVKLTATIYINNELTTKQFLANVKEKPEEQDYKGYLFSYFTGEGTPNGEQIYFSLSQGNDPLHWQSINNGDPVITSELGEKGLRDPFIIRSPEGDKFYMIATDLKIYGNWNWAGSQTSGSRSIMIWESDDLVNWSEQRMVEVSPKEAGNTWAPEIFYDETIGEYVVFWASKLYDSEEDRVSGENYQRMMYATTRDFYTFSEPQVYLDYGYSIIDTTMIEHDGKIYRFTKDERGYSSSSPNGKFIFQEVGDSVLDPNFDMIREGIGRGQIDQGEGPAVFKSNTEEKWYLFIDEFGGRGYVPFETTDLDSGEWVVSENYDLPTHPRHGTVLPITQKEYDALLNNIPGVQEKPDESVDDVKVTGVYLNTDNKTILEGEELQLTATVTPEDATNRNVIWSSSDVNVSSVDENGTVVGISPGTVVITVTTVDGEFIDMVEITVEEPEDPEEPAGEEDPEEPAGEEDPEEPAGEEETEKSGSGEALPNTATSIYNQLLLGCLLFIFGSGTIYRDKKRRIKS